MKPMQYATAASPERAAELVAGGGRYFAGGIDVLGEVKDGIIAPDIFVNVKELPGTREVQAAADRITLGANVRLAELARHPQVRAALPGLAEAAEEVGSPQIRNVATVAGNLAQHVRCWYYRHPDIRCLKEGGDMCYARQGRNRHHSLFTGNPCIAPVVSNLGVMLAALDAHALVHRGGQTQRLSMADLYQMAWFNPLAHNSLLPADLILSVEAPTARNRSAYLQVSERSQFDWALVSCAAAARVEGARLLQPRVALGVVAPVPYLQDAVHALLDGQELTPERAARAADLLLEGAAPLADNGYKIPLAKALVARTLLRLIA